MKNAMRRKNPRQAFTLLEMIVVLIIIGLLAAILYPVFARTHCGGRIDSCKNNLKQIAVAMQQYAQDYEHYPRVAFQKARGSRSDSQSTYGWADAILPYLPSAQVFQCPSAPAKGQTNPRKLGYTDYYFNRHLSGVVMQKKPSPNVVLLGEGDDIWDYTDARYALGEIPELWLFKDNEKSPLRRHSGERSVFAFADGHVKSYKWQDLRKGQTDFTFYSF